MNMFKLLLILMAVLSLLAFACKAKEQAEEVVEEQIENPIDKWAGEVKAVVEKWEARVAEGKLTDADLEEYIKEKNALIEQTKNFDLEGDATEEQKPMLMDLMARMDKLDGESIPAAIK